VAHCPPQDNTSSGKRGTALGRHDIILEWLSLHQSKKLATALTKLVVLIKGGGEVIASSPRLIGAPHNDKNKCYEGTERGQNLLKLRIFVIIKGTEKNSDNHKKLTMVSFFPNQITQPHPPQCLENSHEPVKIVLSLISNLVKDGNGRAY
jgi:hypothetical protein